MKPTAPSNAPDTIDPDSPAAARVLRAFVRDGRLVQIPARHAKRRIVLELLAQEFEPGRRYPEREVNRRLNRWHPDHASLRRFLVDEGFLDREGGQYFRSGGRVDVDDAGRRRAGSAP